MTVGRKGHRAEDFDDELSEDSGSLSPLTARPEVDLPSLRGYDDVDPDHQSLPDPPTPKPCTLPSFDTFIRDTFHRRSLSMPGSLSNEDKLIREEDKRRDTLLPGSNRSIRTLSGTWLRDDGDLFHFITERSPSSNFAPHGQRWVHSPITLPINVQSQTLNNMSPTQDPRALAYGTSH